MTSAALFLVLLSARLVTGVPLRMPAPWWSITAYLWQDAIVVLLFAGAEHLLRRRRYVVIAIYTAGVCYVAATIAVIRVLKTPMTVPMWRAAGGALADSIVHYATAENLAAMALVAIVAAVGPSITARVNQASTIAAMSALALLGWAAAGRVDTEGADRNGWTALALSAMPRVVANSATVTPVDWRRPLNGEGAVDDFSSLRGRAASRHVVLVGLESTAAQYLSIYGAGLDITPNLTRLAQSAVLFDRAYAVYPESIKGLFSTLCSRYPSFDRPIERDASQRCASPAALLADRGYRTALFHAGRFAYLGMNDVIRDRGYQVLADAGDLGGKRESSFGVDEQTVVARMLQWIDGLRTGERFFITYLPIAGHHPYESASDAFPGRSEFDRYRNAVHEGDAALGALIDGLAERGLLEQTVWLIYGDHGEAFGQHERNFGHTFQLYEENVRVPFLVSLPGAFAQPARSHRIVSLVDVAPTLLDLAGLDSPGEYEGVSALRGNPRMALFFADYSLGLLGLRDGRYKFIYEIESGRSRLFDLDRDPAERSNIASANAGAVRAYADHVRRWIRTAAGG